MYIICVYILYIITLHILLCILLLFWDLGFGGFGFKVLGTRRNLQAAPCRTTTFQALPADVNGANLPSTTLTSGWL